MAGPLSGIKIIEFTEYISGPFAGMLLADMGADIIKVEPPDGDPWRYQGAIAPAESRNFISLNRGKRGLCLDLTKPEGQAIAHRLVRQADITLVNFRPDVPARLGIDYETLSAINPRIIYGQITAFGRHGPHRHRPGFDLIATAMSGLIAAEGKSQDGVPQNFRSTALADYSSGVTLAWGVCAALYHRERTGQGQRVETTLLGPGLAWQTFRLIYVGQEEDEARKALVEDLAQLKAAGAQYEELQGLYQSSRVQPPGNVYYRVYQTRDGFISVGCMSDRLRKRLLDVLGLRDIRFEPGYDATTPEARSFGTQLTKEAEAKFREKGTEEWIHVLDSAGIPCGPFLFPEELMEHPQVQANNLTVEFQHRQVGRVFMVGPFLDMERSPLEVWHPSPTLGEHTEEVLAGLGYTREQVEELRQQGVTR